MFVVFATGCEFYSSGPGAIEADKTTTVILGQFAHQCGISYGVHGQAITPKLYRETHSVDAHPSITRLVCAVESGNGINDSLDGTAGKVITENIKTDFFVIGVKSTDGRLDTFYRA